MLNSYRTVKMAHHKRGATGYSLNRVGKFRGWLPSGREDDHLRIFHRMLVDHLDHRVGRWHRVLRTLKKEGAQDSEDEDMQTSPLLGAPVYECAVRWMEQCHSPSQFHRLKIHSSRTWGHRDHLQSDNTCHRSSQLSSQQLTHKTNQNERTSAPRAESRCIRLMQQVHLV